METHLIKNVKAVYLIQIQGYNLEILKGTYIMESQNCCTESGSDSLQVVLGKPGICADSYLSETLPFYLRS